MGIVVVGPKVVGRKEASRQKRGIIITDHETIEHLKSEVEEEAPVVLSLTALEGNVTLSETKEAGVARLIVGANVKKEIIDEGVALGHLGETTDTVKTEMSGSEYGCQAADCH